MESWTLDGDTETYCDCSDAGQVWEERACGAYPGYLEGLEGGGVEESESVNDERCVVLGREKNGLLIAHLDAALALLAVKTLGKNPTGSENLATAATLSTLLGFATTFKDEPEAASEALRCLANTLLLFDHARGTFVGREVNGGDVCFALLDVSSAQLGWGVG